MTRTYPELPGWKFELDEVSAGVYEVVGRDRAGHVVQSKGIDPDELLEKCRKEAVDLQAKA